MEKIWNFKTMNFAGRYITWFQWVILGLAGALLIQLVGFIFLLLKIKVVVPITELSYHLNNPK